jgi:hypothetical protein
MEVAAISSGFKILPLVRKRLVIFVPVIGKSCEAGVQPVSATPIPD